MPAGGNLTLLKGLLYRLKHSFGFPLAVYNQSPQSIDYSTGRSSISLTAVQVKRAIVLPSQVHRSFSYDIGYLKANSNFTYGGVFTDAIRQIIIDRKDLPKGYSIDATDQFYIVYDNKRWEIKTVAEFEKDVAYLITVSRVDGAIVNQIHNLCLRDTFSFEESFSGGTPEFEYLAVLDTLNFTDTVTNVTPLHQLQIFDLLDIEDESGGNIS